MRNTNLLKVLLKLIKDHDNFQAQAKDADKRKLQAVFLAVLRKYDEEVKSAAKDGAYLAVLKSDIENNFTKQDQEFFASLNQTTLNAFAEFLKGVHDSDALIEIFKKISSLLAQAQKGQLALRDKSAQDLHNRFSVPSYTSTHLREIESFVEIHLRLASDYKKEMKGQEIISDASTRIIANAYAELKLAFATLDAVLLAKVSGAQDDPVIDAINTEALRISKLMQDIVKNFPEYGKDHLDELRKNLYNELTKKLPKFQLPSSPERKVQTIQYGLSIDKIKALVCKLIGLEANYARESLSKEKQTESDYAAIYLFDANSLMQTNENTEQKKMRLEALNRNILRRIEYIKNPPSSFSLFGKPKTVELTDLDKQLIADYKDLSGKVKTQIDAIDAALQEARKPAATANQKLTYAQNSVKSVDGESGYLGMALFKPSELLAQRSAIAARAADKDGVEKREQTRLAKITPAELKGRKNSIFDQGAVPATSTSTSVEPIASTSIKGPGQSN